jgi:hypothetical protein
MAVSSRRAWILDQLTDDEAVIFFEPATLDVAIVGLSCAQPGRTARCVVYEYRRLVRVFVEEGMTEDEAVEWMEVNTLGGWLGETTPIVLQRWRAFE